MAIQLPRIIFSGLTPKCGVSTLHTAWVLALQKKKIAVAPCVIGANLAQASLYSRLTRRYSVCFDRDILSTPQILDSVSRAAIGADIVTIEGGLGLQRGLFSTELRSADLEIAKITKTPIIVIIDYSTLHDQIEVATRGLSSLLNEEGISFGIIVNKIPEAVDKDKIRATLSKYAKVVGLVSSIDLQGAVSSLETSGLEYTSKPLSRSFLLSLSELIEKNVDFDSVREIAKGAQDISSEYSQQAPKARQIRIAVAEDGCFSFGFRDNIDLLRYFGAEIVAFSPLADVALPSKIQGLYLPGCSLHEYGQDLSNNRQLCQSIYNFYNKGGLIFAEGSSGALLCEKFTLYPNSDALTGVRLLPGEATFLPGFTKRYLTRFVEENNFAEIGSVVRGVTNEEWSFSHHGGIWNLMEAAIDDGRMVPEGFSSGSEVLVTSGFLHFASNPALARQIVDRCVKLQNSIKA